nr:HDOD domain-containing protein [Oceanisphaera psychrotolerans]
MPDGCGLELIKFIRGTGSLVPIVVISANSDRESVTMAVRHGISDFIAKPFDVPTLQQRLLPLLAANDADEPPASVPLLEAWFDRTQTEPLRLPSSLDPNAILPLLTKSSELAAKDLVPLWKNETTLTARLLHLANSASLRRSGKPVSRLDEAITALGVDMSLRCAMALALDITGTLHDERLIERARQYMTTAEQVASIARAMALSLGLDGLSCYTAGLLSRIGELAVLRTLQDFITQGGTLDEGDIAPQLSQWGPAYGNRLKQQWGLPLSVRELVGAIHVAPTHTTKRSLLIMHLAALRVSSRLQGPEALRMLRQAGLEPEKWLAEMPPASPTQQGCHHEQDHP